MLATVLYLDRKCCSLSVLVQTNDRISRSVYRTFPHDEHSMCIELPSLVVDWRRCPRRYRIESRPVLTGTPSVTRIRKGNAGKA
jgi:hypothetical protein